MQARAEHSSAEYDPLLIRNIIRIPAKENRLVVFTPGLVHRVNAFSGIRYSLAVNIWEERPIMKGLDELSVS